MTSDDTTVVPVTLGDGATIRIEAISLGGREKVGVLDARPFKELTDSIESIAAALGESLRRIKPKKASVEFGVEVGIESGNLTALICKGTGKANLKVTLEWSAEDVGKHAEGVSHG
jgi:hypothetical protein